MPPRTKKVQADVEITSEDVEKRNVYSYAKKAVQRDLDKLNKRREKLQDLVNNNVQYLESYNAEIAEIAKEIDKLTQFSNIV